MWSHDTSWCICSVEGKTLTGMVMKPRYKDCWEYVSNVCPWADRCFCSVLCWETGWGLFPTSIRSIIIWPLCSTHMQQCAAYGFFCPIKNLAILWKHRNKHIMLAAKHRCRFSHFSGFSFFTNYLLLMIWWKGKVRAIYRGDLRSHVHHVLFTASTVQQQPDRLNSITAVWCVETPEVRANSSVYTPESLSQTKTNTFIGFQDLVCCDCPIAFEVSHRFMLFTYSCSFVPSNHHGVFR